MYKIENLDELFDFVYGCSLFGCGGGGSPSIGTELLTASFKKQSTLTYYDIDYFDDEDWICTAFYMGSIAPQSEIEKEKMIGRGQTQRRNEFFLEESILELEKELGVTFSAIIAEELGGINAVAPFAAALGVKFTDSEGKEFIPVGETLINIKNIDISGLNPQVAQKQIIAMCDVENSLYGSKGAAFIFGPQKGADLDLIKKIDTGLRNLSSVVLNDLEIDISQLTGGGAAGGIGAGLYAFLGAKLQPGIDTILETVQVEKELSNTDLIITGEGKIDSQSIEGKVIAGIARMAKRNQVPAIAVVGDIGKNIESLYDTGISGIFSINRVAKDFQITKKNSKADLSLTLYNLFHFIKTISS
ncbi:glycerate kinase family protein [Carnobacterium maltaromaticum]